MLQKTTGRGGYHEIENALNSKYAQGAVGVFGDCRDAIINLACKREVTRVFVFSTNADVVPVVRRGLNRHIANKIEQVLVNPFRANRRDIGYIQLEFLFADLSDEPWDLQRVATMKGLTREFRPRRVAYRWQELDIVAEWVGAGKTLDKIDATAIDYFRMANSLMVEERSDEYAQHCADTAQQFMGVGR